MISGRGFVFEEEVEVELALGAAAGDEEVAVVLGEFAVDVVFDVG